MGHPNPQNLKPFQKGQSGNPRGRPKDTFKSNQLRAILEEEGDSLIRKAIEMAMGGCAATMRLLIERLVNKPKDSDENDSSAAQAEIIKGMAEFIKQLQEQHKRDY